MKKLILLICIAACSLTAASSYAAGIGKEEFEELCEMSGGTFSECGIALSCDWPNGAWITCNETTCVTDLGRVTGDQDNLPQYDPDLEKPRSKDEGTISFEYPTANKVEIQRSNELSAEELSAMERLDKMESIIKEKMYEDIFGE